MYFNRSVTDTVCSWRILSIQMINACNISHLFFMRYRSVITASTSQFSPYANFSQQVHKCNCEKMSRDKISAADSSKNPTGICGKLSVLQFCDDEMEN